MIRLLVDGLSLYCLWDIVYMNLVDFWLWVREVWEVVKKELGGFWMRVVFEIVSL